MTHHDTSDVLTAHTHARTCKAPIRNDASSSVMRHLAGGQPRCLIPFDRRESMAVEEAAALAGRDVRTLRRWCVEKSIGRRIAGGPWSVSRVALAMLLNGDAPALASYLSGDRSSDLVRGYFDRVGLADLPVRWISQG